MLTSINIKRIKQLFHIHRELGVALMLAVSACIELLCGLFVPQPWAFVAFLFAAVLALLAGLLVINVVRFERRFPSN